MKTSIRRDERGFGHAVTVVLAVIVIAAIAAIGWEVMNKNKTSTTTPANSAKPAVTSAVDASCNKVYHDTTLCKFAANSANFAKTPYTAVDTNVDAQGQTSTITIKSDGKGNTALTTSSAGQSYDSIEIGSTTYIKGLTGGDTWTKYTSNAPSTPNPASDIKPDFSTSTTPATEQIQYKNLGKEACAKLTCFKYQIIDPANAGTTQYAWFDTNTYRLQQWYSKGTDGTNTFVITYGAVKITAPSPVTDASNPAASATGTPTAAQVQAAEQQAAQAAASQSGQ